MNELQRQKALEKLGDDDGYRSLPMFLFTEEYWKKENAYYNHLWAIKMMDIFNLPFRILYNYFNEYGYRYLKCATAAHHDNIVLLNRCYPAPGYSEDGLMGFDWGDYDNIGITNGLVKGDPTSDKFDLITYIRNADMKAEAERKAYSQHTWDLETKEGIKRWEYEFAHFLKDIEGYTYFDYFGTKGTILKKSTLKNPKHTKDTISDKSALKNQKRIIYWQQLSEAYNKNPESYRQEEPRFDDYKGEYTLWTFKYNK